MNPPLVSVIIPTYNRKAYVQQAIDSVLAQTYPHYEIIVVDDGSTDGTGEALAARYGDRITYIYQTNQKVPIARNNGFRASQGEYLAFLDSDDMFLPNKLAAQASILTDRPEIGLVVSGYQNIDEAGRVLKESTLWLSRPDINLETILFGGLAPPSAVLLRRSWFDRVGGFDPQFTNCEDMDLWYRLALAGCQMDWVPTIVFQYRIHPYNKSRSPEYHFAYLRRALDKAFADPRMPEDLRARRAELDAMIDLSEASRLAAGGWEEAARERVRRAVATDPGLAVENGRGLAEIAIGLQHSVWGDSHFPEFLAAVMVADIPALGSTMATVAAKNRFYAAFGERRPAEVRRAWFDVARRDPQWLLNRGGWSILRQSMVGFKI